MPLGENGQFGVGLAENHDKKWRQETYVQMDRWMDNLEEHVLDSTSPPRQDFKPITIKKTNHHLD